MYNSKEKPIKKRGNFNFRGRWRIFAPKTEIREYNAQNCYYA